MTFKRLDRVVAQRSTTDVTEGVTYTVLGVKNMLVLIATDKRERKYLSSRLFIAEEYYIKREEQELRDNLEDRGF